MLVSKIKPCMSKYRSCGRSCEWLIKPDSAAPSDFSTRISVEILELIREPETFQVAYIDLAFNLNEVAYTTDCIDLSSNGSRGFLTYQPSMVGSWPTMALTGNGELGFDSGEGA